MTDREKVVKGLECHTNHNCDGCPYYGKNQFDVSLCPTLLTDALELLKGQETVFKPHYIEIFGKQLICGVACGACSREINAIYQFCPYCGRSVKWK